jgi:uncharacterized membrane protein YraQ (UPF0718 family)
MGTFLGVLWSIILETAPYVLIGMFAAGVMAELIGRNQRLRAFATRRSLSSLSFFNLVGFVLPICSCGTVPMAVGFRKQGVPYGSVYAFIFTAPATSIAAVIFAAALMGRQFTLAYVTGAVLAGYAIGALFYLLDRLPRLGLGDFAGAPVTETAKANEGNGGFWNRALRRGFLVYGSEIAFDMIVGLVLVALLISTYSIRTMTDWFNGLPYLEAAGLMILLALPLYICSLPGILMGATMCLSGLSPELVWVFLMSGPITNLGDMNVLRRRVGFKTTAIYMGAVIVVTVVWGMVIRAVVDPSATWQYVREYFSEYPAVMAGTLRVTEAPTAGGGFDVWQAVHGVSAVIYVMLMVYGAHRELRQFWRNPCLHCTHYQKHMDLSLSLCREPCWKRNVLVTIKNRVNAH